MIRRIINKASLVLAINCRTILALFRSVEPKSRKFGFTRGGPIDHYYIKKFLRQNRDCITGTVLEVAESRYSKKFGHDISRFEILHAVAGNSQATLVADLAQPDSLPSTTIDCFICTQTFNFIYEVEPAVKGAHQLLKPGGTLLATVSGISQISRYDMDRWGDYWRFTPASTEKLFAEVFGKKNVTIEAFGNCLIAKAFLDGRSHREFTNKELNHHDPDYPLTITIRATKHA